MALLSSCHYNDADAPATAWSDSPEPNLAIGTLRARCATGRVLFGDEQAVLAGYVVSSDEADNFYQRLSVEDNSGALELWVGLYDLHNRYPVGCRVKIRAAGLCAVLDDGLLQVGLPGASSAEPVTTMGSKVIVDQHIFRTDKRLVPAPMLLGLPLPDDDDLGRLVCLHGLRLDPAVDTTWADPVAATPRSAMLKFRAANGVDSIWVYTSGYATFAGQRVPLGEVSLTGVLQPARVNGRKTYQLKLRDEKDVQ